MLNAGCADIEPGGKEERVCFSASAIHAKCAGLGGGGSEWVNSVAALVSACVAVGILKDV